MEVEPELHIQEKSLCCQNTTLKTESSFAIDGWGESSVPRLAYKGCRDADADGFDVLAYTGDDNEDEGSEYGGGALVNSFWPGGVT